MAAGEQEGMGRSEQPEHQDGWGHLPPQERQDELDKMLREWEESEDHGERKSAFDGIKLTGSDVFFLAARSLVGLAGNTAAVVKRLKTDAPIRVSDLHLEGADLGDAHLEHARLGTAHLEGASLARADLRSADLRMADLESASLHAAHLEHARLGGAHLEHARLDTAGLKSASLFRADLKRASLIRAHLEQADLREAHLEGADLDVALLENAGLINAHLEGARLRSADLKGADLSAAHLKQADLREAHLEGTRLGAALLEHADLRTAHLEGTDLSEAHLEGVDLRGASLDKTTRLNGSILDTASLDQVIFDNTNLAVVPWYQVHVLGDELRACASRDDEGKRKLRAQRRTDYEAAVRAHRQLAARLADQGMIEQANRFIYQALILQRKSHRFYLPRSIGTWTFSWILYLLAGYGYRPMRTLLWYLATITGYAALFYAVTHGVITFGLPTSQVEPLHWYEALILSVSSFHGRGFFQPLQKLGDPVAVVAAVEAVFGLFIEVSFIATFTQRFFSNR